MRVGVFAAVATVLCQVCAADVAAAQNTAGAVGKDTGDQSATTARRPAMARDRLPLIDPRALAPAQAGSPVGVAGVSPPRSGALRETPDLPIGPQAFGSAQLPYTTARVAVSRLGPSESAQATPVTSFPYRAAGKLWVRFDFSWFMCSGSLIGPALVLTAAHCVFNYGQRNAGFADEIAFEPARHVGGGRPVAPYGAFRSRHVVVPRPYFNGTDTCDPDAEGVVCNNDLALVVLRGVNNRQIGTGLGWYRYGWNAYSHVRAPDLGDKRVAQITQLGYPAAFDNGDQMQRTDAVGFLYEAGELKNTHLGTAQSAGSSGGPWIVNFGTRPRFTGGDNLGSAAAQSIIGVTSWGFVDFAPNKQGASFFGQNKEYPAADYGGRGAGNIGFLVNSVCSQARFADACP